MSEECSTTLNEGVRDRACGALLGLAVGDAVGTTLEFKARDSYAPLTDMIGGGPFRLAPGVWTDDTSMALALAESLAERGALDPADLMERFVRWWRDGEYSPTGTCFDIGMTTRAALARFEQSGDPIAGSRSPDAAGNGSLMRLAPVAIYGLSAGVTPMRGAARIQSATTHAARTCLDACEAWSVIVHAAIGGASLGNALKAASTLDLTEPIAAIAGGSWQGKPRDAIRSSGYVVHSFEAALWCVGQGGDFREVILRAANLGDDADTTAAITGQLIGALVGETGIPVEWLDRLAWRERIKCVADRLISLMDGNVSPSTTLEGPAF